MMNERSEKFAVVIAGGKEALGEGKSEIRISKSETNPKSETKCPRITRIGANERVEEITKKG